MSERIVHKIEKHQYANFGKKTVVIYARVSTNKPSQLHSMAMQVSALTQQVYRLWHWRLADIYTSILRAEPAMIALNFNE